MGDSTQQIDLSAGLVSKRQQPQQSSTGLDLSAGFVQKPKPDDRSALRKGWDFANTGLVGPDKLRTGLEMAMPGMAIHGRQDNSREALTAEIDSNPSEWDIKHPILGGMRRGALGVSRDTMDTLSSFTSPLSLATFGLGAAGKIPGAVGRIAKVGSTALSGYYAGKGAMDTVEGAADIDTHGLTPENTQKTLQGASAMSGGTAGTLHGLSGMSPETASGINNRVLGTSKIGYSRGRDPGLTVAEEGITANSKPDLRRAIADRIQTLQADKQARINIGSAAKPQPPLRGLLQAPVSEIPLGEMKPIDVPGELLPANEMLPESVQHPRAVQDALHRGRVAPPFGPIEGGHIALTDAPDRVGYTTSSKVSPRPTPAIAGPGVIQTRDLGLARAAGLEPPLPKKAYVAPRETRSSADVSNAVHEPITRAKAEAVRTGDKTMAAKLDELRERLTGVFDEGKDGSLLRVGDRTLSRMSPAEIDKLKQDVGKITDWKAHGIEYRDPLNDLKNRIYQNLDSVNDMLVPGYEDINRRQSNLIAAKKDVANKIIQDRKRSGFGAGDYLSTGLGMGMAGLLGHDPATRIGLTLSGLALKRALQSPALQTRVAVGLAKDSPIIAGPGALAAPVGPPGVKPRKRNDGKNDY